MNKFIKVTEVWDDGLIGETNVKSIVKWINIDSLINFQERQPTDPKFVGSYGMTIQRPKGQYWKETAEEIAAQINE